MRSLNNACNRLLYKYTKGMQGASIPTDDPVKLKTIISEQQKEIALFREQLHLLKHYRFGSNSETINPDQLPLINQNPDEYQAQVLNEGNQVAVKSHQRRKRARLGFADDLPSRRVELDLEEGEKTCSCCQSQLTRIGEEITRKVGYIPAHVEVIEYARAKYACKACEESIKRASMPKFIFPKSFASPSLLSHLIVSKYVDHLPLYRIEKQFKRVGIYLPRSTMCDWMIHIAEKL